VNETRRHVVALNADIVGYSRLIADDPDGTTAQVSEARSLVDEHVAAAGGELSQFVGDNFMALFDDATSAMKAAISISSELERRNADVDEQRQVRFRMGIEEGDITETVGNAHGDALNVAARIQAIARPGGVSVSGTVYKGLDEPALRFKALGPQRFKNIPEAIDVFEFNDLPSDAPAGGPAFDLALEIPVVAVLPVLNDATDPQVATAADIIRSDIIHGLAALPELTVVDARDETPGGHDAGSSRYMLESGVNQLGDHVRIHATLFDVSTMNVVKARKWTTTPTEMLGLSEEIASEITHTVEIELVVGQPAGLYAELGDPDAIERIYLGWYHLRQDTPDGFERARELFGSVAESHPQQPFGHVLSAYATWIGQASGWIDRQTALDAAWEHAQRGREAGDPTGMAAMTQAAVLMTRGDTDGALQLMDGMEIIRPTCDVTYGLEGSLRRYLGEWETAVDLMDRAMRLTGVNKPWYPTVKACSLLVGGRPEQAASIAQAVLDHQPNNLEALIVLAASQAEMGLDRRARATAATIKDRFPAVDVEAWLDGNPYQDRELVDRWKGELLEIGAIGA
jgi:class 3 adenylate cyclase/TolB-like protein